MSRPALVAADWNFWPDGLAPPAIWTSCVDLGFDGIELGVYEPDVELSEGRMTEAASLARQHGIGVRAALFSMPPGRWPQGALASAEHAPTAVRAVVETGRRAADLGAPLVGVWPGADPHTGARDGWRRAAASLAAIVDGLSPLGLRVAVEPKPGQVIGSTEDALRLCWEIGDRRLGVLLDTAHALAGGEELAALPERIGTALFHVHLGDAAAGDPDADLPPGAVHDFAPFLAALERVGYAGALSFDLYGAVSAGGFTGDSALRQALAHVTTAVPPVRPGSVGR